MIKIIKEWHTYPHWRKERILDLTLKCTTTVLVVVIIALISVTSALVNKRAEARENVETIFTMYKVEDGDTLYSIASKFYEGCGYKDMRSYIFETQEANSIRDTSHIEAGDYLLVKMSMDDYEEYHSAEEIREVRNTEDQLLEKR